MGIKNSYTLEVQHLIRNALRNNVYFSQHFVDRHKMNKQVISLIWKILNRLVIIFLILYLIITIQIQQK